MAGITVSIDIPASPGEVWSAIEPIQTHVEWMADATEIRFLGPQRLGVGTRFECDTRVGPFRLTDQMEISAWRPGLIMGVRHQGLVGGSGRFTLAPLAGGTSTRFTWSEQLLFPWYLGGRLGAAIAGQLVLRHIWAGNLRRLARRVADRASVADLAAPALR